MFYRTVSKEIKLSLTIPQYANSIFKVIQKNRNWLSAWLTWPNAVQTYVDVENFIKTELIKFQQGTGLHTTIYYQDNIVGVLGFNDIHNGIGRAGYWLAKEYTGKGIVTTCLKELIHLGFTHYPIKKIGIYCAEGNLASRSIPMRLAFEQTGEIENAEEINGKWVNHILYHLEKDEYYHEYPKAKALAEAI